MIKSWYCVANDQSVGDAGLRIGFVVDSAGHLLKTVVSPADLQDREGARLLLKALKSLDLWLRKLWADAAYKGKEFIQQIWNTMNIGIDVVERAGTATGLVVLPRRWVAERTLSWLNRNRRLAKDYENLTDNAAYYLYCASIQNMIRRLDFYS